MDSQQELLDPKRFYKVKSELSWFYNDAHAAMGFHSNFSSFLSSMYGTSISIIDPDPYTDGMLKQIKKYRKIQTVLSQLNSQTRKILEACYNKEYRYPPELTLIYGAKVGCVIFNEQVTEKRLVDLAQKKLKSKLSAHETITMFNLGKDAKQVWDQVHDEYLKYWTSK